MWAPRREPEQREWMWRAAALRRGALCGDSTALLVKDVPCTFHHAPSEGPAAFYPLHAAWFHRSLNTPQPSPAQAAQMRLLSSAASPASCASCAPALDGAWQPRPSAAL